MTEELLVKINDLITRLELKVSSPAQEWFSIKGAAVLMSVSPDHVRRAVVGGTITCSNIGTNDRPLYRLSRVDIVAFMEKRKAGAFPPSRRKKKFSAPEPTTIPFSPHRRPSKYQTQPSSVD